jgi:streptogramin lyase
LIQFELKGALSSLAEVLTLEVSMPIIFQPNRILTTAAITLSLCLLLNVADAAILQGNVQLDGTARAGVVVTAQHGVSGIETSVFSDAAGNYTFETLAGGSYTIVAKASGWIGSREKRELSSDSRKMVDFRLSGDPLFAMTLPSATWLDLLPDGDMRREFILNCASCHEISGARIMRDGKPRSVEDWAEAIALMRAIDAYGLTPQDFDDAKYATWLGTHLDSKAIAKLEPGPLASGAALDARFTEYPVPLSPSLPHDLVLGPHGRVWITAFYNNVVWALSPNTGEIQTFNVNENADVMGQVRALNFDRSGQLWILLGGTESLVRLNPADGAIETFAVGMYPHSIEIDSAGKLWFNDYISSSEKIGSIDPKSRELNLFQMPSANLTSLQGLPLLYGLQIDAEDVLWGTMLAANKLFRFDTNTGAAVLFDMPMLNSGPRRLGIAPDGSLWIPEFNTGTVAHFDPETSLFTRHELGLATLGPYDVAVDPVSGHVWAAASLGSAMIRINPATGARDDYPLPTEPAYPRHMAIDPVTGDLWTTYSSMPDATPKIVRIELRDPDRK